MSEASRFSVVLPTYDERENIVPLLDRIQASLASTQVDSEIIVVDDSSPDGTASLVEAYARQSARVPTFVVRRRGERGLAGAVSEGARHGRYEYVIVLDADFSHPPELIPALVGAAQRGFDVAVASRYAPGGGTGGWQFHRLFVSRTATALARKVLRLGVQDPLSGYFAARRELLLRNPICPRGWKILMEVLTQNRDLAVMEVPYTFRDRTNGSSKLRISGVLEFCSSLIRLVESGRIRGGGDA